jgi:predicted ATPase
LPDGAATGPAAVGPGPYIVGLRRHEHRWHSGFPYDVPAVAAVGALRLDAPVTLLAGDNGTGKSTLIEALAEAMDFAAEGGEMTRSGELPPVPRAVLGGALEPVLSATKPRNGYFLRAESFFNIASMVDGGGTFAPDLSLYGDVPLHEPVRGQRETRRSCSRARTRASTS